MLHVTALLIKDASLSHSLQAAFLLPVITRMLNRRIDGASAGDSQFPEVLIICPTRELALQIYSEARKFVHNTIYKPVVCYEGTSVGHQLKHLERGCNILVGTPQRLLDFLSRKKVRYTCTNVFATPLIVYMNWLYKFAKINTHVHVLLHVSGTIIM